ncbi:MAG: DNA integrity scanning protein DisA nucleotide-binding domain protein [Nitrospirae bacterium]|nr:DNA integrity scanning protein DisA nucleotide-binding domain protein [Candidatus Manganitrophaceae bacterium]
MNNILLSAAAEVSSKVGAQAILLYADLVKEVAPLKALAKEIALVLVTRGERSFKEMQRSFEQVVRVPQIDLTRMGQVKLGVMMALSAGKVQMGDRIVCLSGIRRFGFLDSIVVLDIGKEFEVLTSAELSDLTREIRYDLFEAILNLALELAYQGRAGKMVGALFVLGDHERVLQLSRQMIINPFHGYPEEERNVLDPKLKETLKEFAAIDGAFIIREDGVILSAGRHLDAAFEGRDLLHGLGSRHLAAAGITAVTQALAVVVSESSGAVRIFKGGETILELEKAVHREREESV